MLRAGTGEHQLTLSTGKSGQAPAADSGPLTEAEVLFGQPDPELVRQSTGLRWLHVSSAGYEKYDSEEMREFLRRRGAVMTTSSAVYSEPCAQHLLALITGLARRIPPSVQAQLHDHSWPMTKLRAEAYLLNQQTALILGFGAIAKRMVELLTPLGMRLIAVRRRPDGTEPIKIVTESELESALGTADHVLNVLPANPGTAKYFDSVRFEQMKPGAIFYNIGRGATVNQDALLAALQSGRLAAAYLDVTTPEPLPPDHPLWTAPNCYITPHTAGGHMDEKERVVRHFLDNLGRFVGGNDLKDRIF
ncbi:MAG TPA: D-2-hydroxyacid dehydrogenase [Blastocatellia bacterium]|nr:D-2-hydroxyacid dehydrogenase [Blastocatellia bacterium]